MAWIVSNIGTIIVLMILGALVISIISVMVKDKKQGKSSCGGNCAHCKLCNRRKE